MTQKTKYLALVRVKIKKPKTEVAGENRLAEKRKK